MNEEIEKWDGAGWHFVDAFGLAEAPEAKWYKTKEELAAAVEPYGEDAVVVKDAGNAHEKWDGAGWYAVDALENPEQPIASWYECEEDLAHDCGCWGDEAVTVVIYGHGFLPSWPVQLDEAGWDNLYEADCLTGLDGAIVYREAYEYVLQHEVPEFPDGMDYLEWLDMYEHAYHEALDDAHMPAYGRTHAGFRALREELGLSQADVAFAMDVQERTVRRWEAPDNYHAPDDAWAWLGRMRKRKAERVQEALDFVDEVTEEAGKPPKTVTLTYDRSAEEFDERGATEGPYGFANAVTREIAQVLRERGQAVEIRFAGEIEAGEDVRELSV